MEAVAWSDWAVLAVSYGWWCWSTGRAVVAAVGMLTGEWVDVGFEMEPVCEDEQAGARGWCCGAPG